jgi:hypothetical protein
MHKALALGMLVIVSTKADALTFDHHRTSKTHTLISQVPSAIHEQCLKAADYSGCAKANSGNTSPRESAEQASSVDRFGLPKLDSKRYSGPRVVEDADFYDDLASIRTLLNKGAYGRYVAYEKVLRWYQEATPGSSGYSIPITGSSTNCYGSAFGNSYGGYGSTYGNSNCYTTPGTSINVPGTAGLAGGPRQAIMKTVIDCVEKTYQVDGKGRWKSWESTYTTLCNNASRLPKGEEI